MGENGEFDFPKQNYQMHKCYCIFTTISFCKNTSNLCRKTNNVTSFKTGMNIMKRNLKCTLYLVGMSISLFIGCHYILQLCVQHLEVICKIHNGFVVCTLKFFTDIMINLS